MSLRAATAPFLRIARLVLVLALLVALAPAALAQGGPPVPISIAPLKVDTDPNGVNLVTGKMNIDVPTLSVPASPRLRFDRVQNVTPMVTGSISTQITGAEKAYYSVNVGSGTSEAFECTGGYCQTLTSVSQFNYSALIYQREGSGEIWHFDLLGLDVEPVYSYTRTILYYASQVHYPDGEVITYTYDSAPNPNDPNNGYVRRPTKVSSNTGYFISITYQGNTPGTFAWYRPLQAAIYSDAAPTTPLGRLSYSYNDSTGVLSISDFGSGPNARVYQTVGAYNQLDWQVESWSGSVKLPGETPNALTVSSSIYGLTNSVNRDGVQWNYSYTNPVVARDRNDILLEPHNKKYDAVTVTGPNGYAMTYQMNQGVQFNVAQNLVASQTDALGRSTSYTYDGWDRLTKATFPEGNAVEIVHGPSFITSRKSIPKAGSGLSQITETATVNTAQCAPGGNIMLCYRPLAYIDWLGRQTDFEYNVKGQLTQQTGPADGNGVRPRTIVAYQNSAAGISRPSVVRVCGWHPSNPALNTCGTTAEMRSEYEYWGNTTLPSLVRQVDPATAQTRATTLTYDLAGRTLSADGPLPGTADTTYARYDARGRKTWEIGALSPGNKHVARRFTYRDSDDKVTLAESGTIPDSESTSLDLLNLTATTYDSRRYPIRQRTYLGSTNYRVTDRSFLNRGLADCTTVRMNLTALPAATATGACSLGTQGSAGPDRIAKNVYDNAGQLLQVREGVGTTGADAVEAAEVTYTYTSNGKLKFVIDAGGNKAELRYDGHDRQARWVFPSTTKPGAFNDATPATAVSTAGALNEGDYELYGYDANGNRTSLRKRDGSTLTWLYDNLNRVTRKTVPERAGLAATHTRDVFYGYDWRGLQTFARFDSASGEGVSFAYDGFGRKTSETLTMDGVARTIGSQYDLAGNRTRLTWPDGHYVNYYRHAGSGQLYYADLNGASPLFHPTYDAAGRIAALYRWNTSSASWGRATGYSYDSVSRLSALSHDFAGTTHDTTTSFTYNPASQIASLTRTNDLYAWNGQATVDRAYTANGLNQYSAVAGTGFTYDANGNLTSDGTDTFAYDVENRLVGHARPGAWTDSFRYDPLGRLYESYRSPQGWTTRYLWDGDAMVADYNLAGEMYSRQIHGTSAGDDPLVHINGSSVVGARMYLYADERGSIIARTDGTGTVLAVASYDEYGIPSNLISRFGYTGQMTVSGMWYYKARFYSPTLGRFMQTDPIGYEDAFNLYGYVGNDPINLIDPTGTEDEDDLSLEKGIDFLKKKFEEGIDKTQESLDKVGRSIEDVSDSLLETAEKVGEILDPYTYTPDEWYEDAEEVLERGRELGRRFTSKDDAEEQYREIDKAQQRARQEGSPQKSSPPRSRDNARIISFEERKSPRKTRKWMVNLK